MQKTFALCGAAIIKNEADYIEEWIAYHLRHGFEHFFLYDNNSDDGTTSVLRRFVNRGLVTLMVWPKQGGQIDAYNHAVMMYGSATEWMAFFDVDEFFYLENDVRMAAWLRTLAPEVSMVKVPWRNYGFSGHVERPPGLVIENFDKAQDPAAVGAAIGCKVVVRPEAVSKVYVHHAQINRGTVIDIAGRPGTETGTVENPDYSFGRLNHYFTKSVAEFRAKIARGQGDAGAEKKHFGLEQQKDSNTPLPMGEGLLRGVKETLGQLRDMADEPGVFGHGMPARFARHDGTGWHFGLSVSNFTHNARHISNGFRALPIAARVGGVVLYDAALPSSGIGSAFDNVHMKDFLRRNRCRVLLSRPVSKAELDVELAFPPQRRIFAIPVFGLGCPGPSEGDGGPKADRIIVESGPKAMEFEVSSEATGPALLGLLPVVGDYTAQTSQTLRVRCHGRPVLEHLFVLAQD